MRKINKDDFNYATSELDVSFVSEAVKYEEKLEKRKAHHKVLVRFAATAAVLCIVFGAATAYKLFERGYFGGLEYMTGTQDEPIEYYIGPAYSEYGEQKEINGGASSMIAPRFSDGCVIKLSVSEILGDTFYEPGDSTPYSIAVLNVTEVIVGEGFPSEIYFRCKESEKELLVGYESFIMSIDQIGIENYVMINADLNELKYFPHMFTVGVSLGYGDVIPFNDGKVDVNFYSRASRIDEINPYDLSSFYDDYPVKEDALELSKVEKEILKHYRKDSKTKYSYITEADVFKTPEARETLAYMNKAGNVFMQTMVSSEVVNYRRIINGFLTEEYISVKNFKEKNCEIEKSNISYTEEDLESFYGILPVINSKKLSPYVPPHLKVSEATHSFKNGVVFGFYRKIEGKVCGIVGSIWIYGYGGGITYDTEYELYYPDGSSCIIEADKLKEMISMPHPYVYPPMKDGVVLGISK